MKGSLVTGVVIAAFLTGSGQSYSNKCDEATIASIQQNQEPGFDPKTVPSKLYLHGERIVATTTNYFDAMLSDIKDTKFFLCSHSFWDNLYAQLAVNVEIYEIKGDRQKKSGKSINFSRLRVEDDGGLTFGKCEYCPDIIKTAKAYRFFEKNHVIGVYTCNTAVDAAEGRREGFIKLKEGLLVNNEKDILTIPDETKKIIDEAKKKAKLFGLRIHDVSYDCSIKPPSNPPPNSPPHGRTLPNNPSHSEPSHNRHSHSSHSPANDNSSPDNPSPDDSAHDRTSPENSFSKRIFGKHIFMAMIPIVAAFGLTALFFALV